MFALLAERTGLIVKMNLVYEPREDSYLIFNFIRKYSRDCRVLDMGCGGGILSFEASKYAEFVIGCDISLYAVEHCRKNKPKGCVNVKFVESNMFSDINEKFDLIICNPPYLPFDADEDEVARLWNCGGSEGWEFIDKFLSEAKLYLNPDGKILLLFSSLTDKAKVISLIKEYGYDYECLKEKKLFYESLHVYLIY